MSTREFDRLEILRRVVERSVTQTKAAELMGLSERQVRRLEVAYAERGAASLVSDKRGKPSNRRLPAELKSKAIAIVPQPIRRLWTEVRQLQERCVAAPSSRMSVGIASNAVRRSSTPLSSRQEGALAPVSMHRSYLSRRGTFHASARVEPEPELELALFDSCTHSSLFPTTNLADRAQPSRSEPAPASLADGRVCAG